MTIENIVAGYTYNFMAFDDYLAIVFKNELDEDNCYHNLINRDEVEFIRRWKSDTCILDIVKRRRKESFSIIEELARCFEGARISYNDDGTLYISFNMSFERIAFKKIVDLFYPGKYKTEDVADWNFGVRVSDNKSSRLEEIAAKMKEFAWTVKVDGIADEIVLEDLTITYYAFAKWWEEYGCVDFEPQYGLNKREIVLKYVRE